MRQDGHSLLELLAAIAVSALTAAGGLSGLRTLAVQNRVDTACRVLLSSLSTARRLAYSGEESAALRIGADRRSLSISGPEGVSIEILLPAGTEIASRPADSEVSFRAGGLADNATVSVSDPRGRAHCSVVVNQRGLMR